MDLMKDNFQSIIDLRNHRNLINFSLSRTQLGSNGSHYEGQNPSNGRNRSICHYGDDNSVFLDLPKERYLSTGSKTTSGYWFNDIKIVKFNP